MKTTRRAVGFAGGILLVMTGCPGDSRIAPAPARAQEAGPRVDQYGGLLDLPSPNGGNGHWRTEKFGTRWMLVTPDGNGFWMLGVYGVSGKDVAVDDLGGRMVDRVVKKYGDSDLTYGPQANRRLKSWGFNTIGPYSHYYSFATTRDNRWPRGEQPVKMPMLLIQNVTQYAIVNSNNWAPGATKSIIAGVNTKVTGYGDAGTFPDVFDPNFDLFVEAAFKKGTQGVQPLLGSPWLIGVAIDDADYLRGLGAGVDFPTDPPGNANVHLGWVAVVTAPVQSTNRFNGKPYEDPQVYTKLALRDWLKAKYGMIEKLNDAWKSSYSTFDSNGGWGTGSGLLDEDGRNPWVGTDAWRLTKASPGARADMDEFLFEIANKYYSICAARLKERVPETLYFGPSVTGTWRSPARPQVLRAAARHVDVLNTSLPVWKQEVVDYMATHLGDKPMAYWLGVHANADSSLWRHPDPSPTSLTTQPDQASRGKFYRMAVESYVNTVAKPTGSYPSVGLTFWAWPEHVGERANWGLVSLMDNAYDGKEATVSGGQPGVVGSAECKDPWGYPCGAEERDYGDFISTVREVNFAVMTALTGGRAEPGSAAGPLRRQPDEGRKAPSRPGRR